MNPVIEALFLLRPFDVDKKKIRIGPESDGGYILLDDFSSNQAVISYGIGTEYRFDKEMARRGHIVYMFDHTIASIDAISEKMKFYREGVAGFSDPINNLYSIEDHLQKHNIPGDRLILKMDVEGAEFNAIGALPEAILKRFDQIVLEIHGLSILNNANYREKFCRMLRKINNHFTLHHVHGNNCDGPNGIVIVEGLPVSPLLELSYARTETLHRYPSKTLFPTALDFPNDPYKDKLLWFFPFLPTTVSWEHFAACEEHIELIHSLGDPSSGRLVNVARGKPAKQSSYSQWSTEVEACRAVSGSFPNSFAFHTEVEEWPWWQVDLLKNYPIGSIVIHNRLDGFTDRAKTLCVELSDDSRNWRVIHAGLTFFSGGAMGSPLILPLESKISGRFVRLSLGERQCLHLAQVEVFVRAQTAALIECREPDDLPKNSLVTRLSARFRKVATTPLPTSGRRQNNQAKGEESAKSSFSR